MSNKNEQNYKKYLSKNFNILLKILDNNNLYEDIWYDELVAYNKIMGSIIGFIDSKQSNNIQDCKNLILGYYESTYPEKQVREIDDALYSKDCYEYINYASKYLINNKTDLKLLESFAKSYIKGYNLPNDISAKNILIYYKTKMSKYIEKTKEKDEFNKKLYKI